MGYALSTTNFHYQPFRQVLRGGPDQIADLKQKIDRPVMPLHRQAAVSGAGFKDMLNSTVSSQTFKIANDNKAHYEALCRQIQENERRLALARQREKKQDEADNDAAGYALMEDEADSKADLDSAPVTPVDPADVQRTESVLRQIYSYIMAQSFEAPRAREFLHYMMEQQAMQFALQPLPGQDALAQPQQQPQLNFVAIQQMHDNIPHLLSPQMQHDQRGLFAQTAMDMSQPVHSAMAAPVQKNEQKVEQQEKIAPHIERELKLIAVGSQFDTHIVKAATDQLQFNQQAPTTDAPSDSTPETGSSADATSQQQPPKAANGAGASAPTGGNNDVAVSLIKKAMEQNAIAEEAKLKNGNETYISARGIEIIYANGRGKETKKYDSSTVKTEAWRKLRHTADSQGQNISLTNQFKEFTDVSQTVTNNFKAELNEQASEIHRLDKVLKVHIVNEGGVLVDTPAIRGQQAVRRLGDNTQDMVEKSTQKAMGDPIAKLGHNTPGFSMNIVR